VAQFVKAVVLAAGLGTRLRPLTYFVPKALASVGGKPLVDYVLEWLRLNGVKDVAVVGYYLQDVLARYLAERHPNVVFVRSRRLLGTAGQLYYAMEWIGGDDAVVVNTDVLTNLELGAPLSLHKSSGAKLTIVAYRLRQQMRFGALHVEGERLATWREKPVSEYVTAAGIYIISGVKLGEEYLDMDAQAQSLVPHVAVYVAKKAQFVDVGALEDLRKAAALPLSPLKP